MIVIPQQTILDLREDQTFNEKLDFIEDYITENGIPQCDYTRFKGSSVPPIQRFRSVVHRLVSLKKLEAQKQLNFTDLVNVIGMRKQQRPSRANMKRPSLRKD